MEKRKNITLFTRREILKIGFGLTAGTLLSTLKTKSLAKNFDNKDKKNFKKTAKAVIQLWLWGGPSHLDTFDPKPEAGYDYTGPFNKDIQTNVSGIRINQMLPMLAKNADKYSIIRSMTHRNNGHETASYIVQTGREPGTGTVYPSVGAVVSFKKGYKAGYNGLLPPYIVITSPQGRFSEAGFLGSFYKPFATGGDPNKDPFIVEGITMPGVSLERQIDRKKLLYNLDTLGNSMKDEPLFIKTDDFREQAYELILGKTGKVFDLSEEPVSVRERYGRNTFGQSCLLARRLVEKGVLYITINYTGWDTHKEHFKFMNTMLPEMDRAFSALLEDLYDRGLLETTIVWWGGEFGRTPKINWSPPWNGGRDHWGNVFSTVLAGGGFKGGVVIGSSDSKGEEVKERPVYPVDVIEAIYERLGIDPESTVPHPRGYDVKIIPGPEENIKRGGRLTEIL